MGVSILLFDDFWLVLPKHVVDRWFFLFPPRAAQRLTTCQNGRALRWPILSGPPEPPHRLPFDGRILQSFAGRGLQGFPVASRVGRPESWTLFQGVGGRGWGGVNIFFASVCLGRCPNQEEEEGRGLPPPSCEVVQMICALCSRHESPSRGWGVGGGGGGRQEWLWS